MTIINLAIVAIFIITFLLIIGNRTSRKTIDGKIINQLKKAGSDLAKPHMIEFFFYFPDRANAENIAAKLSAENYSVVVNQANDGDSYVLIATRQMLPDDEKLAELREKFDNLAASANGKYDNWGSLVVK